LKRILVVDDEQQMRAMLTQLLEQKGFAVDVAQNGKEGLELMSKQAFDLVITDMIMPVKDGMVFIMELARDFPKLKIIAISGGGAIEAERYLSVAEMLGNVKTLEKPFSLETLLDLVRKALL